VLSLTNAKHSDYYVIKELTLRADNLKLSSWSIMRQVSILANSRPKKYDVKLVVAFLYFYDSPLLSHEIYEKAKLCEL
jgi:hypothetical protein